MTLAELRALFDARTNYAGTANTTTTDQLLNLVYREILSQPRFASLRQTVTTLRTEEGLTDYGVPGLARIDQIQDPANRQTLVAKERGWYRTYEPDPTATRGTPTVWVDLGTGIWWRRPRTSLELFSNSASDTALTIRLRLLFGTGASPPGVGGTADEGFGLDVTEDFAVDGSGAATAVYPGMTPSDVLAFENSGATAHVGTVTLREAPRTAPDPPVATDTGTGTYPAVERSYQIRWVRPRADGSIERSAASTVDTITPSGSGEAVRITRPTGANFDAFADTTSVAITGWDVEVTLDTTPDGDALWRHLAFVPVTATTYDDTTLPEDYKLRPQVRGVAAGGAIIAQLPPMGALSVTATDRRAREVAQIAIFPTPDTTYDLTVFGEADVRTLTGDHDQPDLIPTQFHDLLAQGAVMFEYERRSDQRWAQAKQHFLERQAAMAAWVYNHRAHRQPDRATGMLGDRGLSLGPYFPPLYP